MSKIKTFVTLLSMTSLGLGIASSITIANSGHPVGEGAISSFKRFQRRPNLNVAQVDTTIPADKAKLTLDSVLQAAAAAVLSKVAQSSTFAIKTVGVGQFAIDKGLSAQIESVAAAAIHKGSGFESKILSRAALGDLWSEKSDFQNLRADQLGSLLKQISADYLAVITIRPVDDAAEVAVQFIGTRGSSEGQIIAATPAARVTLDLGGITVSRKDSLIDTLKQISSQVTELSKLGGLIPKPTNFSEHYHNARILSQKGEIDLALESYQQVFTTKLTFADPVIDLVTLLTRIYGKDGAELYIERKLKSTLQPVLYIYSKQVLSDRLSKETALQLESHPGDFPPLCSLAIQRSFNRFDDMTWLDRVVFKRCLGEAQAAATDGSFLAYYIDQIRGRTEMENLARYISTINSLLTGIGDLSESPIVLHFTSSADLPEERPGALGLRIRHFADKMDLGQPLWVCAIQEERGWLGVRLENKLPIMDPTVDRRVKAQEKHVGVVIKEIIESSPASKAGLLAGDMLLSINTQIVANASDVQDIIAKLGVGVEVEVGILRGKARLTINVALAPEERLAPKTEIRTDIGKEKGEQCFDMRSFACKSGARGPNCLAFSNSGYSIGPSDNGQRLDLRRILGSECVSRISYTTVSGAVVTSRANQMTTTYDMREEYGGSKLRARIEKCGHKIKDSR